MGEIELLLSLHSGRLIYYSPYHFIKQISEKDQYQLIIKNEILAFNQKEGRQIIEIEVNNQIHYIYITHLSWDSDYFKIPTYKINFVLYTHTELTVLTKAVALFKQNFIASGRKYCFLEIPSEDILLLQAFTITGFKLIETRLNYYFDNIQAYSNERFPVSKASENDIERVSRVAAQARNLYDRVHADPFFSTDIADQYLATYAEQAVKGFTDIVLIANEKNTPADAFIAISFLSKDSNELNCQLTRIMLTAVASTCRGWHYKLVSEAIYQVKSIQAAYLLMTTQSTNKAVIRNCEKLGFKLGSITHILSDYKNTD